ncbi:MAG TPA: acetolactate synthase small subunit [Balneola sp.]|jgi:acetolactate synthase-1/3 small subunit|nr:acetolactate synthase small subunit [Bacteroidota bacterium]MAC06859.1 acetolactate synthase small subunit [Balneola sp.]MAO77055.1 acetolactate synthase small subunit [Balneola sp.]MBF64622.1 acetolactate synthase small subunit [Balneola sp.]MBF65874.1 acetolactate synthase small subunit [Balneola sp.]|tara:strand:+ start:1717 stop:2247 length:531 start_codon:yes stop_codon:yes gene_type:complete
MEKEEFTITAYTENQVGLLHRITIIFTKRKVNIESLTTSESEKEGIHRFTIAITETEVVVEKIVKQIEKQVEVLKADFYKNKEVVQQEVALYKIPTKSLTNGIEVERIVRQHNARFLTIEKDFLVIEKAGFRRETKALFDDLKPFGINEFVRSGRVAVAREEHGIGEAVEKLLAQN